MNAFAEGFVNGLRIAGALIVIPIQATWFVLRMLWRLDGLAQCYALHETMKHWDDAIEVTDKGREMLKGGK